MPTIRTILLNCIILIFTGCVSLPDYQRVDQVERLPQNWSVDNIQRYYHTSQGTRILPYKWFMALEQPTLSPFTVPPKFKEPEYMGRFGFIIDIDKDLNPHGLPVGFAVDDKFVDPNTGYGSPAVGLTCAACHTAELHIKKDGKTIGIRIEGGPAMVDLGKFQSTVGIAIYLTDMVPGRFDRFADSVLGANHTEQQADELRRQLKNAIDKGIDNTKFEDKNNIYPTDGGFSRTDALGRILNMVFGDDMNINDNKGVSDAPVNFPHIWDAPWFDWVQYNASIMQPMVRNVGEALGVRAPVNLSDPKKFYKSSVRVENLFWIEELLRGTQPFQGLNSPKWPKTMVALDNEKVQRGEKLYRELCQGCHLPPIDEIKKDIENPASKYWTPPNKYNMRFLNLKVIPANKIGTDATLIERFNSRKVNVSTLGMGSDELAGVALGKVTEKTIEKWYDDQTPPTPPDDREKMNGYRPNMVRLTDGYKARPLNGIWATAPYLHNGSVPNLYQLLSPVSERDSSFYLGSKEFDSKNVGYSTQSLSGGFLLDTSKPGNSNKGHEFNDGPQKEGVIGRKLTIDERWELVEYLKSL